MKPISALHEPSRMKHLGILGILLFSSLIAFSQDYKPGVQREFFFGNLPNARTEAMGRNDVAFGESISQSLANAASIGGIENFEIHFSNSAPFYILRNSRYFYLGTAKRLTDKLVLGLSANSFIVGKTTFNVGIGGIDYPLSKAHSTSVGISGAYEVFNGLNVGLNANVFNVRLFNDISPSRSLLLDAGAHYKVPLPNDKHKVKLGISLSNLLGSNIKYEAPDGWIDEYALPIFFRAGASHSIRIGKNTEEHPNRAATVTTTLGISNVINNDYLFTIHGGMEVVVYRILALRVGYFNQTADNGGFAVNFSEYKRVSYGFGIQIPVDKITKNKVPVQSTVDYLSYRPALTSSLRTGMLPNIRTFSANLKWNKNEN